MTSDCQFFASKSSACRRQPTANLISLERGPLWLCVEVHFAMQDRRDQEMRLEGEERIMAPRARLEAHLKRP